MKIICVGHATYDISIPLNEYLKENKKIRTDKMLGQSGGPVCTAAYMLGKWGCDVFFVGKVGNDYFGQKVKEDLNKVKVDTNNLIVDENKLTSLSIILINTSNGSRTVINNNTLDGINDIELDFEPSVILIDGQEYDLSVKLIKKYPNAISIMDADKYSENYLKLANMVDYVIGSHDFAEGITNKKISDNYEEVFLELKQSLNSNIIITLEDRGCLYEYEGQIKVMPALEVEVIDTTGAGDIFHGAFTYAITNKMNFEEALLFSNIAASLSVTKIGSHNSIFDLDEIKEKFNEYW